jgi:hypothetical protein
MAMPFDQKAFFGTGSNMLQFSNTNISEGNKTNPNEIKTGIHQCIYFLMRAYLIIKVQNLISNSAHNV